MLMQQLIQSNSAIFSLLFSMSNTTRYPKVKAELLGQNKNLSDPRLTTSFYGQ